MILIDVYGLMSKAFTNEQGYDIVYVDDIFEEPIIDAQPIKHGYWVVARDGVTRCSICYGASDYERNFCGDCGAKMDLKDGEKK